MVRVHQGGTASVTALLALPLTQPSVLATDQGPHSTAQAIRLHPWSDGQVRSPTPTARTLARTSVLVMGSTDPILVGSGPDQSSAHVPASTPGPCPTGCPRTALVFVEWQKALLAASLPHGIPGDSLTWVRMKGILASGNKD